MLDLMAMCLEHEPSVRPTAHEIVDIASVPDFLYLQEVVRSEASLAIYDSCIVSKMPLLDTSLSMTGTACL